eukprot:TRINITY_DN18660_c0_g1_i1.p1 TRINITY_DN18660_c0_g1~~TRINITY_DN18660_c0_g1_i1.p1  ORF type:complete len:740 (-),score=187.96 TRINITY_DN18660_c0_g1_i1:23-2242(-)
MSGEYSILDNFDKKKLVENVVLAEFDIDRGASIRCQYPLPTGEDEQHLAEMMLPDGVHNRKEDWTVFFLNRDEKVAAENLQRAKQQWEKKEFLKRNPEVAAAQAKKQELIQQRERRKVALRTEAFEALVYELNNEVEWVSKGKVWVFLFEMGRIELKDINKMDSESRYTINATAQLDYASMESLYSCTYSDSYPPLGLRLSYLEQQNHYTAQIEAMIQISNSPPNPEADLDPSLEADIPTNTPTAQVNIPCPIPDDLPPFLYCLNKVVNKSDNTVRRGAVVKALAICSRHSFVHIYRPLLILALDHIQTLSNSTEYEAALKEIYDSINNAQPSLPPSQNPKKSSLSSVYNSIMYRRLESQSKSGRAAMSNIYQTPMEVDLLLTYTPGDLSHTAANSKMKLRAPIYPIEDNIGLGEHNQISQLITRFGVQNFLTIFNAALTGKRVVFVGKHCTSEELSNCVLATISTVCPPLRGVSKRSFPYTNLANLASFLGIPGYIIGTANPIFEERKEWWDLLCNLDTNKVLDSELDKNANSKLGSSSGNIGPGSKLDVEVVEKLSSAMNGGSNSEDNVRVVMRNYVQMILDIGMNVEEFKGEAERKIAVEMNSKRTEQWKKSNTYEYYEEDLALWVKERKIEGGDVPLYVRRLRVKKDISDAEMIKMFDTFTKDISTEEQLLEFLSYMPESKGGLYPIAVSLYHSSADVRRRAAELFKRLDSISGSSSLLQGLNLFLYSGFLRQCT